MNQIQQGDVLIKRIKTLPEGIKQKERDNGSIILAYGEVTGHAHRIIDVDALFYEKDGKLYLQNETPVQLKHEEHNQITIEPGIWEIGQIQEKDWLSGMVRRVID